MADWSSLLQFLPELGNLAGSAAGQASQTGQNNNALGVYQTLQKQYGNLKAPSTQNESPEYYGDTALGNIKQDPAALASYTNASQSLGNIVNSGGMTLADKANQAEANQKLAQQNGATLGNIRNDLQARGALNSGAGLAMQLQAQQQGSQQAANSAQQTAAAAQARSYQAIQSQAQLASQRENQQWQQQAQVAQARDLISQHNAGAANAATSYNNQLQQQGFQDNLANLNGQGKLAAGQAGIYTGQGAQNNQFANSMGTGLGNLGAKAQQMYGGTSGSSSGNGVTSTSDGSGYAKPIFGEDGDSTESLAGWGG